MLHYIFRYLALPSIVQRPKDVTADPYSDAIFICKADGNPKPFVFWVIEGNRTIIFPSETFGRYHASVNRDGQNVLTVQVVL